ncbi:MAG: hypothetical protein U0587_21150 [Candidatus Binatia bacterium]
MGAARRWRTGGGAPSAVTTVRVVFASDAGARCCIAVAPSSVPVDPASGQRLLVLDALPPGPATFTLSGFATDFAPAPTGIDSICPTNPANVGRSCDTQRPAAPSFVSDPQKVTIVAGTRAQAPTVEVYAVPFVLELYPAPGDAVQSPLSARFTTMDAVTGIDRNSIVLEASFRSLTKRIPLTLSTCDDATQTPCSPQGTLQVSGYRAISDIRTFPPDLISLRILANDLNAPPEQLDFTYTFTALDGADTIGGTADSGSAPAPPPIAAADSVRTAIPRRSGATSVDPAYTGSTLPPAAQARPSANHVRTRPTMTPAAVVDATATATPTAVADGGGGA